MRIIAGSKKGMKLFSPQTQSSRPITDRVKESLFSVLYKYDLPGGAIVADLFCGVGSLGLEALSRGAAFVSFVERDPKVVSTLKRNIEKAGFVEESKVIRADAFKIGAPIGSNGHKYDLVFVDPPYAETADISERSPLGHLLNVLQSQVMDQGVAAVRAHQNTALLDNYGQFQVIERRRWGTMTVAILQKSRQ